MDVHQSAQFINLDGDEGPFFEILKSRFFQLDGERLHALRRPELYLRLGLIAERQLSGDEPVLRLVAFLMHIDDNVVRIHPDSELIANFDVGESGPFTGIDAQCHVCKRSLKANSRWRHHTGGLNVRRLLAGMSIVCLYKSSREQ